jgi:hypothetical protein
MLTYAAEHLNLPFYLALLVWVEFARCKYQGHTLFFYDGNCITVLSSNFTTLCFQISCTKDSILMNLMLPTEVPEKDGI